MKKCKGLVLLIVLLAIMEKVNAGPGDDPNANFAGGGDGAFTNAGGGDPGEDPDIPLDPGTWVLVAAGVGYGVKKWRDAKQGTGKGVEEKADLLEANNIQY